jgi:D-alanyl-D-alanine carboxypeptidase
MGRADHDMSRKFIIRRLRAAAAILFCATLAFGQASAASLVVDAQSGAVLSADAPNHLWYPASLTKMMTVYVALSEIKAGRLSFGDTITVSSRAASVSPVRFGLEAGQKITVRQAINAAIVASGNDAATALAEKIGVTEEKFAHMMTLSARGLGMTRTVFRNASGLPNNEQVTTAHDMVLLAIALLKTYPQHYELFNQRSVTIGKRSRGTVNGILGSYKGADGFKTGFTCGSGYNLVASAMRDGRRVVGVVLGSTSRAERTSAMVKLLDKAFAGESASEIPLDELVMATADEGAPPVVLSTKICAASSGTSEDLVQRTARAGEWGIVFGSFSDKAKAQEALSSAKKQLGSIARGGTGALAPKSYNGIKQWSAMILGLSQTAAGKACKALWAKDQYCLALRPEVLGNKDMAWR